MMLKGVTDSKARTKSTEWTLTAVTLLTYAVAISPQHHGRLKVPRERYTISLETSALVCYPDLPSWAMILGGCRTYHWAIPHEFSGVNEVKCITLIHSCKPMGKYNPRSSSGMGEGNAPVNAPSRNIFGPLRKSFWCAQSWISVQAKQSNGT